MDDELQCPYCGENAIIVMDNPQMLPWDDGEDAEITCESCGKKLKVVCVVKKIEWKFFDDNWDEIEYED